MSPDLLDLDAYEPEPRAFHVRCFDGMCGAEDCPRCHPGCELDRDDDDEPTDDD